jgi:PqqD family protein of HPr-rel-A system
LNRAASAYRIRLAPGVIVEPIGDAWAAFSELKGSTHLLNAECAAILECLASDRRLTVQDICAALFPDEPEASHDFVRSVHFGLETLVDAGLAIQCEALPLAVR